MALSKAIKKRSPHQAQALKLAEMKMEKKKKELIKIKALHKKVAREFIDLWMVTRRMKHQRSSK